VLQAIASATGAASRWKWAGPVEQTVPPPDAPGSAAIPHRR